MVVDIENVGRIRLLAKRTMAFARRKDICLSRDLTPQWVWENKFQVLSGLENALAGTEEIFTRLHLLRPLLRKIKPPVWCLDDRPGGGHELPCHNYIPEDTVTPASHKGKEFL